jgi:pimeloyl-ACP methyl ester carboxylesterase
MRFMRIIKRAGIVIALFSFGILIFSPEIVFASTNVISNITEDTVWDLAGSPYVVQQNDIRVQPGVTLIIEPGVIVKIKPRLKLLILGSFIAEGTVADRISFTSLWDDSIGGDTNGDGNLTVPNLKKNLGLFSGIQFIGAKDVTLKNSDIYFSADSFNFWSTSASISNIRGRNNQHDLMLWGGSDVSLSEADFFGSLYESVYLSDSVFVGDHVTVDSTQNFDGFISLGSSLSLIDSVIQNVSSKAINAKGPGTISLERVTIKNSKKIVGYLGTIFNIKDSTLDNTGIDTYNNSTFNINNSVIKNTIYGIKDFGGSVLNVTKSKIINNNYGIYLYKDLKYSDSIYNISDTTISGNSQYGAYTQALYPINLKDVWWGDASGPYHQTLNPAGLSNAVSDNILFDPWCKDENCTVLPSGFSNVLFLPGLEASRLYSERFGGSEDQLWEPNRNQDVEDLYLNTDGTSKNPDIYTRDIIKETNSPLPSGFAGQNIYKSFANTMDELVSSEKISAWKAYAYDWRQDVQDIVNNGTKYQDETVSLVDTLQALADSSKSKKVTIVAHSNGGLLAKALLKKLEEDKATGVNNLIDKIDTLILVAVPEIGTASAVPAILHGYDQRILLGFLLDEVRARELGRNMKSAFGLLPSREYINRMSASPATFKDNIIPSNATTKLVNTFGSAIDSYSEYKSFLFGGEGRVSLSINQINLPITLSENLFAQAENLHDDIDAWTPPEDLRVIEVAGWGLDTLASFEYYPVCETSVLNCTFTMDQRPRFTESGDGTVVVPSAQYMSLSGNAEKYWVDLIKYNQLRFPKVKHANILETDSLLSLISDTIQKLPYDNSAYLSNISPVDTSNRLRLSIHSPVNLDAYDSEGNHTGKVCPPDSEFCYAEENIANSSYFEFGEGKYINIPEDELDKVKLQGTGTGTFTYESEQVLPDGTSNVSLFIDIPVTTQTQGEITINPNTQAPELKLDVTGDGVSDFTIQPGEEFDPIIYLQILKTTINSLDLPPAKKIVFNNRVDTIIKSIQDGKINLAELKASKFKFLFEKQLSKTDPKKPKPKQMSKTDAQLLLDMFNKLLDNIS